MLKYFKLFKQHSDYESYISNSSVILPNLSKCLKEKDLHFKHFFHNIEVIGDYENTNLNSQLIKNKEHYEKLIIPNAGYAISNVTVMIDGTDETANVYNSDTNIINIPHVLSDVSINVETSSETIDNMFLFRGTGNSLDIKNDKALLKSIKGNTIVNNQWFARNTNEISFNLTNTGSNAYPYIGSSSVYPLMAGTPWIGMMCGHVYYLRSYFDLTSNNQSDVNGVYVSEMQNIGYPKNTRAYHTGLVDKSGKGGLRWQNLKSNATITGTFHLVEVFDLTAMFGPGREPIDSEFELIFYLRKYGNIYPTARNVHFEKFITKEYTENIGETYYAYDLYYINQWTKIVSQPSSGSVLYLIPCNPNTTYNFIKIGTGTATNLRIGCYNDSNLENLLGSTITNSIGNYTALQGRIIKLETEANTSYIAMNYSPTNYIIYEEGHENILNDIDINVTRLTGKLNGTGNSVTIFPDGMKSVRPLYDAELDYFTFNAVDDYSQGYGIQIPYVPTGSDVVIEFKFMPISYSNTANNYCVFFTTTSGSNANNTSSAFRLCRNSTSTTQMNIRNNTTTYTTFNISLNEVHELVSSFGSLTLDNGEPIACDTTAASANSLTMCIFLSYVTARFYYFKVYKAGTLVFDGIPVRVGEYAYICDRISNRLFRRNPWTVKLTPGNDIETEHPIIYDEIKQDNGVWKAYKRVGDTWSNYKYNVLETEQEYILDNQDIPTEVNVSKYGIECINTSIYGQYNYNPAIIELQYGVVPTRSKKSSSYEDDANESELYKDQNKVEQYDVIINDDIKEENENKK